MDKGISLVEQMKQIKPAVSRTESNPDLIEAAVAFFNGELKPFQIEQGLNILSTNVRYVMAGHLLNGVSMGAVEVRLSPNHTLTKK